MSFLRAPNTKPEFTSLQVQTSTSALPVPIIWGTTKASGNLLFYANFKTQGASGGKGGLFAANQSQTYSADVIIGLCEGMIGGIGSIWRDQSTYALADLGLTLFEGSTPQATWSYLATNYPTQALGYQGTAYLCAASYQLGSTAQIGNHNFEIKGAFASTGGNGIDADPALVIYDFLTSAQYGAGLDAASIDMTTLEGSGGDASLQTYCKAMGISFSPCLANQEQASSVLTRWLQVLNCAAVWSQGQLKFIPYGDQAINSGNVTTTIQVAIPQPTTTVTAPNANPSVIACTSSLFISDGGVKYANTGSAFSYIGTGNPGSAGQYGMSPNGEYLFNINDAGRVVQIEYTYAIPVSYVPYLTPIYALTDLDFLTDGGNKDPVTASRVDPFSLPNIIRVECLSRNNQYAGTPVEARDQADCEMTGKGPRVGSTITAREICDDVVVGPIVAQAILQRQLYVRVKYQFKLSVEYCLLDPMDIVEITDVNLGLTAYPVRIVSITEDEKGNLAIEAEELTIGVSSPGLYNASGRSGYIGNQAIPAAPVNGPLIYEPPPALTNGVSEIWVGASGGSAGVADPNWGGANVWVSVDNVTYSQVATISQALKQGALTASLAAASGWDMTLTLAVDLTESAATLSGTSMASAQSGSTLALVGNELLAYETATLTSAYHYNLTNMQRGLYGTTGASHSSGARFARLNSAVVKYTLARQYIGVTLYFKFQSFNVFGVGVEALSACTAYTFTPSGAGAADPIAQQLQSGFAVDLGPVAVAASVTDDFGSAVGGVLAIVDLGVA